jgi:hypothetical protein
MKMESKVCIKRREMKAGRYSSYQQLYFFIYHIFSFSPLSSRNTGLAQLNFPPSRADIMSSILFLALTAALSVNQVSALPNISTRDNFTPKEHLVLGDCGIGKIKPGESTSRQMFYFTGSPWVGGSKWAQPMMMANVPWDGSYPWRPSGVSAKFPNGDIFTVQINKPNTPDGGQTIGSASHTYDSHPFECYPSHLDGLYTLEDGTKCSSAFVCYHNIDDPPKPPAPAEPELVYMAYKEKIKLMGTWNAHDIFKLANLTNSYYCDEETAHPLEGANEGGAPKCTVKFKCGPQHANKMVTAMEGIVARRDEFLKQENEKITPNCIDKSRVCGQFSCYDVCHKYGSDHRQVTNVAKRAQMDLIGGDNWKSHMEYTISCPKTEGVDDCGACKDYGATIGDIVNFINPVFGFGTKVAFRALCGSGC